ncbi:MAG: hypothetical protein MRJ68_18055 [Nitrospira sp.]|nr:hypothetical protein [Nitrospira sp.]
MTLTEYQYRCAKSFVIAAALLALTLALTFALLSLAAISRNLWDSLHNPGALARLKEALRHPASLLQPPSENAKLAEALRKYYSLLDRREPAPEEVLAHLGEKNIAAALFPPNTPDAEKLALLAAVKELQEHLLAWPMATVMSLVHPRKSDAALPPLLGETEQSFRAALEDFKNAVAASGIITFGTPSDAERQNVQRLLLAIEDLKLQRYAPDLQAHFSDAAVLAHLHARLEHYRKYRKAISDLSYAIFALLGHDALADTLWALLAGA